MENINKLMIEYKMRNNIEDNNINIYKIINKIVIKYRIGDEEINNIIREIDLEYKNKIRCCKEENKYHELKLMDLEENRVKCIKCNIEYRCFLCSIHAGHKLIELKKDEEKEYYGISKLL